MAEDGLDVDLSLLPDELKPLAPLIRKYAVADDVERGERLSSASVDELRALHDAPQPHWDAINAYLGAHIEEPGTPQQDVAIALDGFAQAALEAAYELEERNAG